MANLRYVCLSDLHLGARYSILTAKNPLEPSAVLKAFASPFCTMLNLFASERSPSAPLPELVLNGDVLDLGLSPINDCVMGFQRFLDAIAFTPTDGADDVVPLLSGSMTVVPGNHDHVLWKWADDDRYVKLVATSGATVPELDPVTPMFLPTDRTSPGFVESRLLTELVKLRTKDNGASVRLAYPNLAVSAAGRTIVFHHGHYLESEYRLMSRIRRFLALGGREATTVAELERENGTWMDFVWSTLGDAGLVGKDARNLYTRLQGGTETELLIREVTRRIVTAARPQIPMGGERQVQSWARHAVRALLDVLVQRSAELERNSYETVLGDDTISGLRWYLETPVAAQFIQERQRTPVELVFVFGHTHKPFHDAIVADGYPVPVLVFNTGGWVLDEPVMATLEGAGMVLIDDLMNVVSLRLYNQSPNGDLKPVHVAGAYPQTKNPLLDSVNRILAAVDWTNFTTEVGKALVERQRAALDRFSLPAADRTARSATAMQGRQAS